MSKDVSGLILNLIAIDTNVLLRYLLRDDELQAAKARLLFERKDLILITDVVLVEAIWTLMGRKYKVTKSNLVSVVYKLMHEPNVCFEDRQVIWRALRDYRKSDADFADAVIVHKSIKTASIDNELEAVYTFDRNALQLPNTVEASLE